MNSSDSLRSLAGILARIRIVLVRTSHPGNIGAAARAMKTMGLKRLVLVAPEKFPDPVAGARATGALDLLVDATVCDTLQQALEGTVYAIALSARKRELAHPLRLARDAAAELAAVACADEGDGEVAVVFGAEESGLTNLEAALCRDLVQIPANPQFSSLNLGAAVQVMAYELRLAALERAGPLAHGEAVLAGPPREPARFEEVENLFRHLESTMIETGFLDPEQPKRLVARLRRMFARSGLEKEEVNILRGFLSSVNSQRK